MCTTNDSGVISGRLGRLTYRWRSGCNGVEPFNNGSNGGGRGIDGRTGVLWGAVVIVYVYSRIETNRSISLHAHLLPVGKTAIWNDAVS